MSLLGFPLAGAALTGVGRSRETGLDVDRYLRLTCFSTLIAAARKRNTFWRTCYPDFSPSVRTIPKSFLRALAS